MSNKQTDNLNSTDKTHIRAFSHIEELSIHRKPYMPGLYYKRPNDLWRNGNQQSSYELCGYIRRYFQNEMKDNEMKNVTEKEDNKWTQYINDILKNNPEEYGTYAGLDNWCHHFTDAQLSNFYDLIENNKLLRFE